MVLIRGNAKHCSGPTSRLSARAVAQTFEPAVSPTFSRQGLDLAQHLALSATSPVGKPATRQARKPALPATPKRAAWPTSWPRLGGSGTVNRTKSEGRSTPPLLSSYPPALCWRGTTDWGGGFRFSAFDFVSVFGHRVSVLDGTAWRSARSGDAACPLISPRHGLPNTNAAGANRLSPRMASFGSFRIPLPVSEPRRAGCRRSGFAQPLGRTAHSKMKSLPVTERSRPNRFKTGLW